MTRFFGAALLVFLLVVAPQSVHAQQTIGTPDDVPMELRNTFWDSNFIGQTFVPTGPSLVSISLWFYGFGTDDFPNPFFGNDDFDWTTNWAYSDLYWGKVGGPAGPVTPISQTVQGKYTLDLGGVAVEPGADYYFSLYTRNSAESFDRDFVWVPGQVREGPQVLTTVQDTYANGFAYMGPVADYSSPPGYIRLDNDLRFEVVTVPEPSTWTLMLTGLFGLGFVAWRQRKEERLA